MIQVFFALRLFLLRFRHGTRKFNFAQNTKTKDDTSNSKVRDCRPNRLKKSCTMMQVLSPLLLYFLRFRQGTQKSHFAQNAKTESWCDKFINLQLQIKPSQKIMQNHISIVCTAALLIEISAGYSKIEFLAKCKNGKMMRQIHKSATADKTVSKNHVEWYGYCLHCCSTCWDFGRVRENLAEYKNRKMC